jgi:phosphoglycerate dehydrogenase-like enzyme
MKILVPDSIYAELIAPAQEYAHDVQLLPYREDAGETIDGQEEAVGVLRWIAGKGYARLVRDCPQIRWLHTASAGVDHVLTPDVKAKAGLVVTDSGPAFEIAISEFVLAWMLLITRRLPELMANQHARKWSSVEQRELYGQTVGIIGLGPIGRGVATRCKAFGMRTLGLRRAQAPAEGVDQVLTGEEGLHRLLSESDFVVLAAALTGETHALLGASQLAAMKKSVWLINIARGGLVDETALIAALQSGQLGGACLDVFASEPLSQDSPLWEMPNVYIAPHNSSGWTKGLHERQKTLFLENLGRFTRGEPLESIVDIARGY